MKKILFLTAILSLGIVGCGTPSYAQAARDYKYGKLVILGYKAKQRLEGIELHEKIKDESGRLSVQVTIQNRTNRQQKIQARCLFKNESGAQTEDMPFETKNISEEGQEIYSFISLNKAENYIVEVKLVP